MTLKMNLSVKFGLFNAVLGFLVAWLLYSSDILSIETLTMSISSGFCAFVFWKLLAKNPVNHLRVLPIGFLTGMASHCFLLGLNSLMGMFVSFIYYTLVGENVSEFVLPIIAALGLPSMIIGFLCVIYS